MGKGNPFAAAERHIQHEKRALRKDRTGDYRRALSMTDALFGNILGDVHTARKRLTAGNARDLAAIQRLMARSRAGVGSTRAAMMAAGGHTAASDFLGNAFQEANAAAGAGVTAAAGQARAGAMQASGAQSALDMIRGTVKATGNAADYAASQALSTRATQDAATIGAQQHDLDMARIQFAQQQAMERQQEAFQMQMAQMQADQAAAQAEKDFHYSMRLQQANLKNQTLQQANSQYGADINSLSNATSSALRVMQSIRADNLDQAYGQYKQAQQAAGQPAIDETSWLATKAAAAIGVGQQDPAMPLIARLAGVFIAHDGLGGPNTRSMVADTIVELLQAYPQFRGVAESALKKTVEAELRATASNINAQNYASLTGPTTDRNGVPTQPPAPGYNYIYTDPSTGKTTAYWSKSGGPENNTKPVYQWDPKRGQWDHFLKWDPKQSTWVTWQ